MPDEDVFQRDTNALVNYYVALYELPVIKRDESRKISYEQGQGTVALFERAIPVTIRYPIIPLERLEEVVDRQSSTYTLGPDRIELEDSDLTMVVEVTKGTSPDYLRNKIGFLEQTVQWKNNDVIQGNQRLRQEIQSYIELRKKNIEYDRNLVEGLVQKVNIPLERKTSDAILSVDLSVKKSIALMMPPKQAIQEPTLSKDSLNELLRVIKNAGKWFERAPKVYSKLNEEELRDIILSGLNMIFQGQASGETFSRTGKTDIFLVIPKGGILIAECKIWQGQKYYQEGIDQLFSYLTWRENFGIMVTFSKNKEFTDVISAAKNTATGHPTYKKGTLREIESSHFVTDHTFPTDSKKSVEVHHILFTLEYADKT